MAEGGYLPYPPCFNHRCIDRACCAKGYRFSWPEMVGQNADATISVINKSNPLVTVVRVTQKEPVFDDFCCNRVYLFVGPNNTVTSLPQVG